MRSSSNLQDVPKKLKLLIVDDERSINETLSIIFKKQGYEVLSAHDGAEAIRLLFQEQPDLALLDVSLPDMSGIDIAIRIRQELPTCKFVLFSGNQGTVEALDGAKSRGYDFEVLAKPVRVPELIAAFKNLSMWSL